MKKTLLLLSILCLSMIPLFAQTQWMKTNESGFQDVAVAENGTIWACSMDGRLCFSNNRGGKWKTTRGRGFLRIAASDKYLVCCTDDGLVVFSDNEGRSWRETSATDMVDVAIGENDVLYACGKDGSIWISQPNNFNMLKKTDATGFQSIAVNKKGLSLYAVGKNGTIWYASYNPNKMVFTKTEARGFAQIAVGSDGTVWACSNGGIVFFSKNVKKDWHKTKSSDMIACDSGGDITVAVDNTGTIWLAR